MIREEAGSRPPSRQLQRALQSVEEFYRAAEAAVDDLPHEMVHLSHMRDLIDLKFARMAARLPEHVAEELGSATPYDWMRHKCRMTGQAVMDRLSVGQYREKLADSVRAVEDGEIGFAHLAVMSRAVQAVECSRMATGDLDQEVLLKRAQECSPGKLRYFCDKARHAADREAVADEQSRMIQERTLEIEAGEYGVTFHGWLDSVGGAALRSALEPLAQPSGADDDRPRSKRLADALVEMSFHSLDAGTLPMHGGQRPHIQVTTTLDGLLSALGAEGADVQYSQQPISYKTLERLTCDSTISRVLVNAESVVVDVGRASRTVSPAQRRALNSRDGGCRWPGCDRGASWSAAHHLKHWTKDQGPTNLDNLVLLCYRHHTMLHEGSWQLVPTENGFKAIPPPLTYYGYLPPTRAPDQFNAA